MEPDSTERREMSPVEKADKAWSFAFQITSGSAAPMVLKAVIELGVLEIIKKAGPNAFMSPAEIAAQLPTSNPEAAAMLGRMLRLLASYSVLSHSLKMLPDGSPQQLYGLAPVCEFLTKNGDDGASLAPFFLMLRDKVIMESWYRLKDAVLEGTEPAFNKAHGTHLFEYCGKDRRFNSIFNEAMSNHSTITVRKILDNYDGFKDLSSLVDVGGGIGVTLSMIVSKYPTIEGINFDLPHVVENAPSFPGVEHVGGDMYVTVPKGDAILLKWICHNWEDEECLKLLKNCYEALPADHGKVVACEHVLPDKPETSNSAKAAFNLDVIMLAHNGGKERTEGEFEAIAKEAGFAGFKVACSAYNTTVMEFLKK